MSGVLTQAGDPEPEEPYASKQQATVPSAIAWGWLPIVALTSAFGILITDYAFNSSRYNGTGLEIFFFLGLPLIVAPTIIRLISPVPARFERIGLLCILGLCLYLVKVEINPLYITGHDEFLHWRTAQDITKTKHLFSQNSLLPVSPYYPGLEIVTDAFSLLSDLDIFYSGLIVVGIARLVMILSLFFINERITKSPRIASIATMVYMANPEFLVYDAQFVYGSLGLSLAMFMIYAMGYYQPISSRVKHIELVASSILFSTGRSKDQISSTRWIALIVWIVLGAMSLTHPLTSFFFDGLLLCWAIIDIARYRTAPLRSKVAQTAAIALVITIACVLQHGNPVIHYFFSQNIKGALYEFEYVLTGVIAPRQFFIIDGGSQSGPIWGRILIVFALVLPLVCIPFGWLCLWKRYRFNTLAVTFGILSFLYPIAQIGRLVPDCVHYVQRSATFLFIPIAFLLAISIGRLWPTQRLYWRQMLLVTCMLLLLFLGGAVMAANGPFLDLPGPYMVIADTRSIEPEGIQIAIWARSHLGLGSRIATDEINQLLMGTYGDQYVVTPSADRIDVSAVFFSSDPDSQELSLLRRAQVRYLVVDLRLTRSLPTIGGDYYSPSEPGADYHAAPIDVKALTKFSAISQVNQVFDGGDIVIYDVGGLLNAPQKP